MRGLSSWRARTTQAIDGFVWCAYLLVLAAVSFTNNYYSSQIWLSLSAGIYLLCCLSVFSMINGGKYNRLALLSARFAILILCLMLLLLALQMIVSLPRHTELLLLEGSLFVGDSPSWFKPEALWSIVPDKTRWLLNSEILMFAVFVLSIVLVSSRRRLKQLLVVLLTIGLVHSVVGVLAKYGGFILVDAQQLDGHYTAARGWFINRNHFAAFVSLCMVGGLAFQLKILMPLFMSRGTSKVVSTFASQLLTYRLIFPLALILGVIALALSQSRAGFLAFVFPLLLLCILSVKTNYASVRRATRRRQLYVLFFLLSVIAFVLAYFGSELLARFTSNALLGERLAQWSLTWEAIQQSWLLGYGGNSYADVFQIFRSYHDFRQVIYNQSHNDYLHIWLEQGLLGLVLWLGLLAILFRAAYIGIMNTKSSMTRSVLISVLLVVIAALLQSAVDFNLQILNIRYYFFVIISLVFSVPALTSRRRRSTSESTFLV